MCGFDITEPNLEATSYEINVTLDTGYNGYRKIGSFYNKYNINNQIDSMLDGVKNEIFRYLNGIEREKMEIRETAKLLGIEESKVRNIERAQYFRGLREQIVIEENNKIDEIGREKFIRRYFEANSIFKTDKEMTREQKEELIELYNEEISRVKEERRKKDEKSIKNLNLSTRVYKALKLSGYKTIDDLLVIEDDELEKIRGLGAKGIEELKEVLLEKGYKRPMSKEDKKLESLIKQLYKAYDDLNKAQVRYDKIKEELSCIGISIPMQETNDSEEER